MLGAAGGGGGWVFGSQEIVLVILVLVSTFFFFFRYVSYTIFLKFNHKIVYDICLNVSERGFTIVQRNHAVLHKESS